MVSEFVIKRKSRVKSCASGGMAEKVFMNLGFKENIPFLKKMYCQLT